jgi:hypothetical protein
MTKLTRHEGSFETHISRCDPPCTRATGRDRLWCDVPNVGVREHAAQPELRRRDSGEDRGDPTPQRSTAEGIGT